MIRPDGTVSDAILSPITEAQRVPSIGHQLTIRDDLHARADAGDPIALSHGFGGATQPDQEPRAAFDRKPVPLNLWDTSADSIPETWSL